MGKRQNTVNYKDHRVYPPEYFRRHKDSATDSSATPSHQVSIKEPEAPKMIYQFGSQDSKPHAWQTGSLERRGNRGDDHSQLFGRPNTVGPKAGGWKALEFEGDPEKTGHKKDKNSTSLDIARSQGLLQP